MVQYVPPQMLSERFPVKAEIKYSHHYDSPSSLALYQLTQGGAGRAKDRMGWLYTLLRKKPAHKGCGSQNFVAKGCGVYPSRHFATRTKAKLWPTGFV